jgi:hypothetical protein
MIFSLLRLENKCGGNMKRFQFTRFIVLILAVFMLACQILTEPGQATPTLPSGIKITGTWWFENNIGDGYLITNGMIRNDTTSPVWGIIRIDYLDANQQPIQVTSLGKITQYDRDVSMVPIPAGGIGYFQRTCPMANIHGKVANVSASILSVVLLKSAPRLEISQFAWNNGAGGLTLTGVVKNTGNEPCPNPALWAVFNQGAQVTGINARNSFDTESLAPGQTLPFTFLVSTLPDKFDTVTPAINCPQTKP